MLNPDWIVPQWPAPASVRAVSTTRAGGGSEGPYRSLNLGDHVEDDPASVKRNRAILSDSLGLAREPCWVRQVHGCDAVETHQAQGCDVPADAVFSRERGHVCVVMTADCLPVLFCDRRGTTVAAAHAGWRGLAAGVLENTVDRMGVKPGDLMVWLGPAIGPEAFEVGDEVRQAFMQRHGESVDAFKPSQAGRWLADIYALARILLRHKGVDAVHGGGFCTYTDNERFFSYRRDGVTGRMGSLIWLE